MVVFVQKACLLFFCLFGSFFPSIFVGVFFPPLVHLQHNASSSS